MSAELSTDTVALGDRDGMVVLEFQKPVRWCTLDPATALQVGLAMARSAHKAKTGLEASSGKAVLSVEIRNKLVNRVELVAKNLQERGKNPRYIAEQLVDIVLREMA